MSDPMTGAPAVGVAQELAPGVLRILAPNPSPMTFWGTNTYLVCGTDVAVIDPGPNDPGHLDAILRAVPDGRRIRHILVTHTHLDHSPLARPLAEATGAPVLAFGDAQAGRSPVMEALAGGADLGGGEGIDAGFEPDELIRDGQTITGGGWDLEVLHTPGHLGNHLCLGWGDLCFTADHVMGWASSLVSPPDGDLTDFMESCRKLRARPWARFFPGHGDPIDAPGARLDWLIGHRQAREAAILAELGDAALSADELARRIYTDTPAAVMPAAARNVLAHLIDLMGKNQVAPESPLTPGTRFSRR